MCPVSAAARGGAGSVQIRVCGVMRTAAIGGRLAGGWRGGGGTREAAKGSGAREAVNAKRRTEAVKVKLRVYSYGYTSHD